MVGRLVLGGMVLVLSGSCLQSGDRYSIGERPARPDAAAAPLLWGPATRIDHDPGFTASAADLAMDTEGNIMALWLQSDAGGLANQVCASLYTVSGWQSPTVLNPDAASHLPAYQPRIAAAGKGDFFAVWSQAWQAEDQLRIGVYGRHYVFGSGWEAAPTTIFADEADAGSNATGALDIAANAQGNAIAVWGANDATWAHFTIQAARNTPGTGWAPAQKLSMDGVQSATPPAVAMDGGNTMVLWGQAAGDNNAAKGLQAARYTASGWEPPIPIEPAATAETRSSAVARIGFEPSGNAIAVWSHSAQSGVYAMVWSPATGWGSATVLADTRATGSDEGVRLAIDRQGHALVLWNHQGGGLLVRRYAAGVWEAATLIDAGPGTSGDIAVNPAGAAVAVWLGHDGHELLAKAFWPGSGWGEASVIASNASEPRIVIDRTGTVTVLWTQDQGLFAARARLAF
jgi:hypothetical protein